MLFRSPTAAVAEGGTGKAITPALASKTGAPDAAKKTDGIAVGVGGAAKAGPSTAATTTMTTAAGQQPSTSKKVSTVALKTAADDKKGGGGDHHPVASKVGAAAAAAKGGKKGAGGAAAGGGGGADMTKQEVSKMIAKGGPDRKGSLAGQPPPELAEVKLDENEDDPNLTKEERERRREMKAYVYRILQLCQKSDWHAVEQALRYLEKAVVLGLTDNPKPLTNVQDEVRNSLFFA